MASRATGISAESEETDVALLARMAARDQEALSCLYDRYRGAMFALALRILRDRTEAEEVLADVFIQAWRGADEFDKVRGSVPAWLVTLCRSRAIDRLRARGRREAAMTALTREEAGRSGRGSSGQHDPEVHAEVALRRGRIRAALAALSPRQREAIELAYYGDLSHTEIAARLAEPLGTVKTWIRQGMMTLKDRLIAQFEGD